MAYVKDAGIANYFDEEKYYTSTKNYGNLSLVELRFQEMRREVERINEIVNDVKSALNSLVSAINALAGLVGAATIPSTSATIGIDLKMEKISSFVNSQIERYAALNEFTYEQIKKLDSLLMELFDEDGQLVTYEIDGKEVTESFTDLLNRKENETALTNPYNENYRNFDRSDLNDKINAAANGWETFEAMYSFFSNKGLTDEQIAGVLGNAALESGFNLEIKNSTSTAKGLFQWLDSRYPDDWSLEKQLNHAWEEMETRKDGSGYTVNQHLKNCSTADGAAKSFAIYFEGCTEGYGGRVGYATEIYNYIKKMKGENINTPKAV